MADATPVTYTDLVAILADLRYTPDPARSSATYSVFRHPDRPLPIFLQVFPDDEPVRNTFVAMVYHILHENDPASAREFERRTGGRWTREFQGASTS
jgi:hypothetical protein